MSDRDLNLRFAAAAAVCREAGKLALDYYRRRSEITIESKGLQDLVSIADRATEDLIVGQLSQLFPMMVFRRRRWKRGVRCDLGYRSYRWHGQFLRGIPFWCISLALVKNNNAVSVLFMIPMPMSCLRRSMARAQPAMGAKLKSVSADPKRAGCRRFQLSAGPQISCGRGSVIF